MKVTLPIFFLLLALPGAKGAPIRIFPEGTPGLEGRVKEALEMFQRGDFSESTFALPIFLLAIAQFPRSFPAEILGLNLAWQFLDLSAFGPA